MMCFLDVARAPTGCSTGLRLAYPDRGSPSTTEGPAERVDRALELVQAEMDACFVLDSTLILRGLARSLSGITSERMPLS